MSSPQPRSLCTYCAARKAVRDAHLARWPKECRACDGAGAVGSYQSHPYGMGSAQEYMEDVCASCEGTCPRCRAERTEDEDADGRPCPHCHWQPGDAAPPPLDMCPDCDPLQGVPADG